MNIARHRRRLEGQSPWRVRSRAIPSYRRDIWDFCPQIVEWRIRPSDVGHDNERPYIVAG